MGVEFKDFETYFPPTVVVLDGFANARHLRILEFAHAGFPGLVDREIPVRAMLESPVATAYFLAAGEGIADQAAAHQRGPRG